MIGVSQTPRPIIPSILRKYLPKSIQALQAAKTESLSSSQRSKLEEIVINEVKSSIGAIKRNLGSRSLPRPSKSFDLYDLYVSVRTYNCLLSLDLLRDSHRLESITINDLLTAKNFGVRSLVDLLTAIEWANEDYGNLEPKPIEYEIDPKLLNHDDWALIRQRIQEKRRIPMSVCQKYFPPLPKGFRFDRLSLSRRTMNRIEEIGLGDHPEKLAAYSLGDFLRLPNFGISSFAELITGLEDFIFSATIEPAFATEHLDDLFLEANFLFTLNGAENVTVNDPRFGRTLQELLPDVVNAKECAERILGGEHTFIGVVEAKDCIRKLRIGIERASQLTLEDEIRDLVSADQRDPRTVEIFLKRNGLDGSEECTLQQIGDVYGITRERVRQICSRVEKDFQGEIYSPIFDKTISFIAQQIPALASEVEARLKSCGYCTDLFRLENLKYFAELCSRDLPFIISDYNKQRFVTRDGLDDDSMRILSIARKEIETWGVALIENIIAKARVAGVVEVDNVVRGILMAKTDFDWLDEKEGWFWLSGVSRNRLLNQVEKVLATVGDINISDLRQAVRRHYRMKGFAPPTEVLLEFCRQQDTMEVDGQIIRGREHASGVQRISDTEAVLVDVLKANNSVMQREDLEKAAISRGMKRSTFYVAIDNSPVITRFARGVYGLSGAKVQPGLVESLKPKVLRGRVLKDFGWSRSGEIWIGYRLSKNSILSGLLTLPAAIKSYVDLPCIIQGTDKTMLYWGTGSMSVGNLLQEKQVEVGSILILLFDKKKRSVAVILGHNDLLEEFQAAAADSR